jgi:tetratricopeptide (TPR) repeat protein
VIDLLTRETEGNAFFMVEVVRALAEEAGTLSAIGHATLPQGIMTGGLQAIVRRRLDRVPAWAQPVLKLAAIAGRQLDLNILYLIQPDTDWDSWLNICAEAAVLDVSDNVWRFSHDKLREAVILDIPETDRSALYRAVAEAIETAYPDDSTQAEVLMEYWHAGGHISKTLLYTRQSVECLVRLTADYERAKPLIERGLRLAQQPGMAHHTPYLHALFATVWAATGNYELAETHYEIADRNAQGNNHLRIQILNELSAIDWRRGNYIPAQQTAEKALHIARAEQDRKGIAAALNNLGSIADYQGQFAEARKLYEESLVIRQELGDRRDIASSLSNMGVIAMFQGDYEQAHDFYAQSIAIRRQIGDRQGVANSLNNMAVIAMNQGNNTQARLLNEESLSIRKQIGDKHNIANSLNNLGLIALEQTDYSQAQTYYNEALSIQRMVEDRWGIANSLANLGLAAINQGDYAQGQTYHDESLAIQREMGDRGAIAISLMNLGWSAYLQGQYDQAHIYQNESLALRREIGERRNIANTLVHMALVALAEGDEKQARLLTDESLALYREIGDRNGMMNSLANQGFIALHQGDWQSAASAWHDSLSLSLVLEMTVHRLDVLVGVATRWFKLSRYEAAAQLTGLAQAHSATRADTKSLYLLPLVNDLRIVLHEVSFSKAWAAGAASDLKEVIAHIVAELAVKSL